ncbi:MAG: transcription termination/antitermination protein NusG [Bradymonadales bacterium]|jgi:transcriptional antiterminator NusG
MSEMKWYIVNAHSGCENKAKAALEERIRVSKLKDHFGRVLIPTETVVDKKGDKGTKRTTTRKFYPGYILVEMQMTDETWHLVHGTPKISGFVGGGSRPPAMSDKEVEAILNRVTTPVERVDITTSLEVNDTVKILSGSFANFTASVNSIDREKSKVSVMVEILGRVVPVDLEFKQVERVDAYLLEE